MYSYTKDPNGPLIEGNKLDLRMLLDIRGFWQRHLLNSTEATFYDTFLRLAESLRPQFRKTDNSNHMSLSSSWLGYYCESISSEPCNSFYSDFAIACVHPLPLTLDDLRRRQSCADLDSHWDQIEMMVSI